MEYEFLAAVQIIVYVVGVGRVVVFLHLPDTNIFTGYAQTRYSRRLFAGLAVVCGLLLTTTIILQHSFVPSLDPPTEVSVAAIGTKMLSVGEGGYSLPFEVVSLLLLAAIIGCITIAIKAPGDK